MMDKELEDAFEHAKKSVKIAYGLAKWFIDDIRLYVRANTPRWKREVEYFWPMIVEAKTPLDVYNMSNAGYAEFRNKLPFVKQAKPLIFKDDERVGYHPEKFRIFTMKEKEDGSTTTRSSTCW